MLSLGECNTNDCSKVPEITAVDYIWKSKLEIYGLDYCQIWKITIPISVSPNRDK